MCAEILQQTQSSSLFALVVEGIRVYQSVATFSPHWPLHTNLAVLLEEAARAASEP